MTPHTTPISTATVDVSDPSPFEAVVDDSACIDSPPLSFSMASLPGKNVGAWEGLALSFFIPPGATAGLPFSSSGVSEGLMYSTFVEGLEVVGGNVGSRKV